MKKFVRILSLTLVAVMLCAALASCGKVSGAYAAEISLLGSGVKVTYDFGAFGKVAITTEATVLGQTETKTYEGKYKVEKTDDDKQEITFTFENDDSKEYSGTYAFEKDKENDAIKIAGVTYKAVKD